MALDMILLLAVSLIALVKSSDLFVEYAARLARHIGLTATVIGLTIVAVGTSLPELAASMSASFSGAGDLALGNVLGSNAANFGLVLGICAFLYTLRFPKRILLSSAAIMLFATLLLGAFLRDLTLEPMEGGFLLLLFAAYILFLVRRRPKWVQKKDFREFLFYFFGLRFIGEASSYVLKMAGPVAKRQISIHLLFDFLVILITIAAVQVSAYFAVQFAVGLASVMQVPNTFVGLTLISIGTSLPELSVGIAAARKGLFDIVVGNVIGSNIANIFLVAGAAAAVGALTIPRETLAVVYPALLAMTLFLVGIQWRRTKIAAPTGALFFLAYLILLILVFFFAHPVLPI